ncbi:MAG: FxsA family protein, partial [Candidatus Nanohaloarchaea archaeon]|nr:FxsA family protein [Candidatus Nanohaloarchaea archaeon]
MLGALILLFILLPALDLFLLLKIGTTIGLYRTLLLIVGTGFAGAVLYRSQKWVTFQRMRRALQQGQLPDTEVMDTFLIMAGAFLL